MDGWMVLEDRRERMARGEFQPGYSSPTVLTPTVGETIAVWITVIVIPCLFVIVQNFSQFLQFVARTWSLLGFRAFVLGIVVALATGVLWLKTRHLFLYAGLEIASGIVSVLSKVDSLSDDVSGPVQVALATYLFVRGGENWMKARSERAELKMQTNKPEPDNKAPVSPT